MQSGELPLWPETVEMRDWQNTVFEDYMAKLQKEYLIVATPGAGKTTAALRIAHEMLRSGRVMRLVVVVPTRHLRKQWAEAAFRVGIDLDYEWEVSTGGEIDFHGLAVTYAQFSYADARNMHRYLVGQRPTIVIFDEIHHAGTSKAWGDGIEQAFVRCPYKLALSGTPFRSDRNAIPFVCYEAGRSVPDFPYSYPHALDDGVCRQVVFPSFNGRVEYMRGDDTVSITFDDDTNEQGESDRLRAFLAAHGDWLRSEITDAHSELLRMRKDDPDAGGLLFAMDVAHARAVAKIVADIAHEEPVIAVSDDPDASKNIDRFAKGSQAWLIAVKMMSEGVDIPRLRVGVYATNTTSELFFRQAVGRFVRMRRDGPEEQTAAFYIPEDSRLIALALQIKDERDHIIPDDDEYPDRTAQDYVDGPHAGDLVTTLAEAEMGQTIFEAESFEQQRLLYAEQMLIKAEQPTTHRNKILAVKLLAAAGLEATTIPPEPRPTTLRRERKDRLSKRQSRRVGRLAHLSGQTYAEINKGLAEELGARLGLGKPVFADSAMTEEHRRLRGEILEQWIRHWEDQERKRAGLP